MGTSLNLDGGGWRMPTMEELSGLYKKEAGSQNMTPLLKTSGRYVWSGENEGSLEASRFYFIRGDSFWLYRETPATDGHLRYVPEAMGNLIIWIPL